MAWAADEIRRYQIIIGTLFLIACIVYLIVIACSGIETEVMRDRFRNADTLFNGEVPVMEYPPFALVFMVIPRLFADTPLAYNVAYVAEVFIFMVIGLFLISKLAERFNYDQKKAMLAYAILILLMLEFVTDRYDIFPMVLTLASFYFFTTKKYAWAFMLLAVGTLTKLYPAILFPLYLIYFMSDRKWSEVWKGTAAFIITALAIVVPVFLIEPDMITHFLGYHTDRPLQIESVASSLIYPLSMLGLTDVWIEYSFGSDNLMGSLPDAVASVLTPLMVISILLVYAAYAHVLRATKKKNEMAEENGMFLLGMAILVALLLFMIVGKVFSSQYLIWIIPPLIFIFMVDGDSKFKKHIFNICALSLILTQALFAYSVGYLGGGENINDAAMMIMLARNILVLLLTYYVLRHTYIRFIKGRRTGDGCSETTDVA